YFFVIVRPSDPAKPEGNKQDHPNKTIGPVRPEQSRYAYGDEDQGTAHGRGTGLLQMAFRAVGAHGLADLQLSEAADHPWPRHQSDQQSGRARQNRSQGDVFEHPESPDMFVRQPARQLKQHDSPPTEPYGLG